ncbi:hypothetical protein IFR05_015734 [Cadophora sp. M221]|nr:hypothetical protein IFR05_015734 [Cadophora sp. M221]
MPNKPPHPPYSETYVLPKTKYGIPVTPEMFENNSFNTSNAEPEDHKSRWWEKVWAEEAAKERHLRDERDERGEEDDIDRRQRYRPTTVEELEAYRTYQRDAEEIERRKAGRQRFRQAAREAGEIMKGPKGVADDRTNLKRNGRETVSMKEITPWEFEGEDEEDENDKEGEDNDIGEDGENNKLKKWFKKILP